MPILGRVEDFESLSSVNALVVDPQGPTFASELKNAVPRSLGQGVQGVGQIAEDIGWEDNPIKRYGQDVIERNPTQINSLEDIAEHPLAALGSGIGNAAGFMLPAGVLGMAGKAYGLGRGAMMAAQTVNAGIPSYGGIRENQIQSGHNDPVDMLAAGAGALTVGAIENMMGVQAMRPFQKLMGIAKPVEQGAREAIGGFSSTALRTGLKEWGKTGLGEGFEEILQNPIEQVSAYQDPTTSQAIDETLFGGAMGVLGGLGLGGIGGFSARNRHKDIANQLEGYGATSENPTDLLKALDTKETSEALGAAVGTYDEYKQYQDLYSMGLSEANAIASLEQAQQQADVDNFAGMQAPFTGQADAFHQQLAEQDRVREMRMPSGYGVIDPTIEIDPRVPTNVVQTNTDWGKVKQPKPAAVPKQKPLSKRQAEFASLLNEVRSMTGDEAAIQAAEGIAATGKIGDLRKFVKDISVAKAEPVSVAPPAAGVSARFPQGVSASVDQAPQTVQAEPQETQPSTPAPVAGSVGEAAVIDQVIGTLPAVQQSVANHMFSAARDNRADDVISADGKFQYQKIGTALGIARGSVKAAVDGAVNGIAKGFGMTPYEFKQSLRNRGEALRTTEMAASEAAGLSPSVQTQVVDANALFGNAEAGIEQSMGVIDSIGGSQSEIASDPLGATPPGYVESVEASDNAKAAALENERRMYQEVLDNAKTHEARNTWNEYAEDVGAPDLEDMPPRYIAWWVSEYGWLVNEGKTTDAEISAKVLEIYKDYLYETDGGRKSDSLGQDRGSSGVHEAVVENTGNTRVLGKENAEKTGTTNRPVLPSPEAPTTADPVGTTVPQPSGKRAKAKTAKAKSKVVPAEQTAEEHVATLWNAFVAGSPLPVWKAMPADDRTAIMEAHASGDEVRFNNAAQAVADKLQAGDNTDTVGEVRSTTEQLGAGETAPLTISADTGLFAASSVGGSHPKAVQSHVGILNSYIRHWNGAYTAGNLTTTQLQAIADALVDVQAVVGEGFLSRLRGFSTLENDAPHVSARSLKQHGAVLVNPKNLDRAAAGDVVAQRILRDDIIHEVAHQWDIGLNDIYSVVANLPEWRKGGKIHTELSALYASGKDYGLLGYPLVQKPVLTDDTVAMELFAQTAVLYFTSKSNLVSEAPSAAKIFEEVLNAINRHPQDTRGVGARRNAVYGTLRASSVSQGLGGRNLSASQTGPIPPTYSRRAGEGRAGAGVGGSLREQQSSMGQQGRSDVTTKAFFSNIGQSFDNFLANPIGAFKEFGLGWLTMEQLVDVVKSKSVRAYADVLTAMQQLSKTRIAEAAKIDVMWGEFEGKNPALAKNLSAVMREATRAQTDPAKKEGSADLIAKYEALPQAAKDIYTQVRDYYAKGFEMRKGIMMDAANKAKLAGKNVEEVSRLFAQMKGPYFPLMRIGRFYSVGMSAQVKALMDKEDAGTITKEEAKQLDKLQLDPKHYITKGHTSRREAIASAKQLEQQLGHSYHNTAAVKPDSLAKQMPDLARVEAYISSDLDGDMRSQVKDMMVQMYFDMLPESHALKRQMKRKGIYGEEEDMRRVFASSALSQAHYISRLKYSGDLNTAMQGVRNEARRDETMRTVENELTKRAGLAMEMDNNPFVDRILQGSYFAHLGLSPAFILTNMTQVPMITIPWLGARHGFGVTNRALAAATADTYKLIRSTYKNGTWRSELDWTSLFPKGSNEDKLFTTLLDRNALDITMEHDLGAVAEMKNGKFDQYIQMANLPVRVTEIANRAVTGLAAYRLAMSKPDMTHEKAVDHAVKAINETQLNYSALNAPRHMNSVLGSKAIARLMFQFRKYQQGMIYLVAKNVYDGLISANASKEDKAIARKTLLGLFGTTGLMAGSLGLPFAGSVMAVAGMIGGAFDDDDEPFDVEATWRNFLTDLVGKDAALVLAKGAPTLLGIDLSKRVGMGDLGSPLPFMRQGKTGTETVANTLAAAAGASVGTIATMIDGIAELDKGNYAKGAEKIVPVKLAQNLIRTYRYNDEGLTNKNGEVILPDEKFSAWDLMNRAAGFQPTKESEYYSANQAVMTQKEAATTTRSNLLRSYAQAKLRGESTTDIDEKIAGFNQRHPDKGVRIDVSSKLKAVQARRKMAQERNDAGVRTDKTNQPYLDSGRFAVAP